MPVTGSDSSLEPEDGPCSWRQMPGTGLPRVSVTTPEIVAPRCRTAPRWVVLPSRTATGRLVTAMRFALLPQPGWNCTANRPVLRPTSR